MNLIIIYLLFLSRSNFNYLPVVDTILIVRDVISLRSDIMIYIYTRSLVTETKGRSIEGLRDESDCAYCSGSCEGELSGMFFMLLFSLLSLFFFFFGEKTWSRLYLCVVLQFTCPLISILLHYRSFRYQSSVMLSVMHQHMIIIPKGFIRSNLQLDKGEKQHLTYPSSLPPLPLTKKSTRKRLPVFCFSSSSFLETAHIFLSYFLWCIFLSYFLSCLGSWVQWFVFPGIWVLPWSSYWGCVIIGLVKIFII